MPRFRPPAFTRGSTATALLLGVTLLLACVVAWRARAARAAQRVAVQRLMQDHAGYAADEFTRRSEALLAAAAATLQQAQGDRRAPPASVQAFADSVHARDLCACLGPARGFFRMDLPGGSLARAGTPPGPQATRWLREEVAAAASAVASHPRPRAIPALSPPGSADGTAPQPALAQVRTVDGRLALLAFTLLSDEQGRPRAAYGVLDAPGPLLTPLFQRVLARVPLLPASLMRGAANDSLLRVSVVGADGSELWSSAPATWTGAHAEEPMPAVSGLAVRAEILPRAVPWLLHGGVPGSSQPLLLGLMALAAGVLVIAFMQTQRQHALARIRADFVSGVSHELRTPITQIRLFSELLLGGRLRTDEERQHSLRLIDREARRLTFLVERILDFNRSERGALRVQRAVIDAQPILREVLDGFERVASARGMVLRTALEPELVAPLDAYAVRHVLLNFLENAVKYGPPGQIISVGAERGDGVLRLWVEDGGPGVPPAERTRIWEPYYRMDRPADRVVGGSGIGLSLVRDLVARHYGRAWVEDGERRGARFVAEFPGTWDAAATGSPADGAGERS